MGYWLTTSLVKESIVQKETSSSDLDFAGENNKILNSSVHNVELWTLFQLLV